MLYTVTYFEVQPNFTTEAVRWIGKYRAHGAAAAGSVQVEALYERARSSRFVVLQTWSDESAFQAHESAEDTLQASAELKTIESAPFDQRVHHGLALTAAPKGVDAHSLLVVTHIDVPPPRKDETEILLRKISQQAVSDAGNGRYDVLQQTSRPNHFTTVAVWDREASFQTYASAPHTREFRRQLAPMMGGLYDERLYGLSPQF